MLVRPLARARPVAVVRPAVTGGGAAHSVPYAAMGGAVVGTEAHASAGGGAGAQFVPDATQRVPGMVTGTVYMPPSP